MRVRKSVPEGYKTGGYSAFTLFQDAPVEVEVKSTPRTAPRVGTRPRARELTPFCGILKVGGLAVQSQGIYDDGRGREGDREGNDADDEDDMPVLSQGSTVSNASTMSWSGTNKRRFEDEDNEGVEQIGVAALGGRVIAVPRKMKRGVEQAVRVVGQENLGDIDFEDAEFLDYGLDGGGDEEMGGV
jgi:hypothetical protein